MNENQKQARAALIIANESVAKADEKCQQVISEKKFGEEFHQACEISENAEDVAVWANFAVQVADREAKTGVTEIRVPADSHMQYLNGLCKKDRSERAPA